MSITSLLDLSQAERATAYTSKALYWTGAEGNAGNPAEVPIQIFAPNPAQSGSSISHIDPNISPNSLLMYPYALSGQIEAFTLSPMELGMLSDMGYMIVPEPGTGVLLFVSLTAVLARRWFHRRLPV